MPREKNYHFKMVDDKKYTIIFAPTFKKVGLIKRKRI